MRRRTAARGELNHVGIDAAKKRTRQRCLSRRAPARVAVDLPPSALVGCCQSEFIIRSRLQSLNVELLALALVDVDKSVALALVQFEDVLCDGRAVVWRCIPSQLEAAQTSGDAFRGHWLVRCAGRGGEYLRLRNGALKLVQVNFQADGVLGTRPEVLDSETIPPSF